MKLVNKIVLLLMVMLCANCKKEFDEYGSKYSEINSIKICNWLHGAKSALTFTWDDTNPAHAIVAEILEEYDFRGSFYIYPMRDKWNIQVLQSVYTQLAQSGHEIGNHTMRHKILTELPENEVIEEIAEAIPIIYNETGVWPVSFSYPHGRQNRMVDSIVLAYHLFAKRVTQYNMANRVRRGIVSSTLMHEFSDWLNSTYNDGKWLIITGHGIDGGGWESITSSFLHEMCQEISAYDDSIWVGTLAEIAAYEYLKEELNIKHSLDEERLTITITGYDNYKYDKIQSLPISIQLKLAKGIRLLNDNIVGISIDFRQIHNDYIITFDVKQMQTIVLSLAKNSI